MLSVYAVGYMLCIEYMGFLSITARCCCSYTDLLRMATANWMSSNYTLR